MKPNEDKEKYVEINLASLILKLFNRIKSFFNYIIYLLLKFYYVFLVLVLIIIALYYYFTNNPRVYYSDLSIGSEVVSDYVLYLQSDKIEEALKNDTSLFQLPESTIEEILEINVQLLAKLDTLIVQSKAYSTLKQASYNKNLVIIRIYYTRNLKREELKQVETAIVNYLNNLDYNKYITNLVNYNLSIKLEELNRIYRITDSAIKIYYKSYSELSSSNYLPNQIVFSEDKTQEFSLYHNNLISLHNDMLKNRLLFSLTKTPVYVAVPFVYREYIKKNYIVYLLLIVFTFVSLFIIDNFILKKKSYDKDT